VTADRTCMTCSHWRRADLGDGDPWGVCAIVDLFPWDVEDNITAGTDACPAWGFEEEAL
jgi:hypothetical protein